MKYNQSFWEPPNREGVHKHSLRWR